MGLLSLTSSMTCSGEHRCILMFTDYGVGRAEAGAPGAWKPKICPRGSFRRLSEELKLLPAPIRASGDRQQLHRKSCPGSRLKYGAAGERCVASAGMPEFMFFVRS